MSLFKTTLKSFTLWFTGLPCAGKTTLSNAVEKEFISSGRFVEHLDGDALRKDISKDLGYSRKDRETQILRVAYIASSLTRNGVITLVSIISPYRETRQQAREKIHPFIEIYVRCPLAVCEKRDVKGMYRLAREGKIANFTGISDEYEEPLKPEIVLDTDRMGINECVEKIMDYLERLELILPCSSFPEKNNPA